MPFFLQAYKIAHHLRDVDGRLYLLYGFPGNIHWAKQPNATKLRFKLLINIALKNVYCAKK